MDAHLIKDGDRIMARAELDLEREPAEKGKFELPLFNLFGGGRLRGYFYFYRKL